MGTTILTRNCPKCNKQLFYKLKGDFNRANKKNMKCRSCVLKIMSIINHPEKHFDNVFYTEEEIIFLKENYPRFGSKLCAQRLNRTLKAIRAKASLLGLKFTPHKAKDEINCKVCPRCKLELNKVNFGVCLQSKNKLNYICKKCLRKQRQGSCSKLSKSAYDKNYRKIKSKDPKYIIRRVLRRRFKHAIHSKVAHKFNSVISLIGCSVTFLKDYLEKQFTKGMNWSNYGEWHIDHIIPLSKFNLFDIKEQERCFHYSNLRPLWATTEIAMTHGESEMYIGNLNKGSN